MRWHLTIYHPDHPPGSRVFESAGPAWNAFDEAARRLEADGFRRGEVEVARYGLEWIERLKRAEHEAVIQLLHVPATSAADTE